jgi:uncharacterized membrane protein YcaP (DUF421 family)
MKKEEIHLYDVNRILFGDQPPMFLLEVILRTLLTYLVLLVVLKLLGKRMSGKLTNTEQAVMLMFGAVVSSGAQIPDRGVLEASFVLFLILLLQRGVTLLAFRSARVENKLLGTMSMLVKDGVMQLDLMAKEKVSKNQLFSLLRRRNISHLGEVKRLYMETTGDFSLYKAVKVKPGLSVSPEKSNSEIIVNHRVGGRVCDDCGKAFLPSEERCSNCQSSKWVQPVKM